MTTNWNKQMGFDFEQTHKYNRGMIEEVAKHTIRLSTKYGHPKEVTKELHPDLFHWNIFVAGLINRCNDILMGKFGERR